MDHQNFVVILETQTFPAIVGFFQFDRLVAAWSQKNRRDVYTDLVCLPAKNMLHFRRLILD